MELIPRIIAFRVNLMKSNNYLLGADTVRFKAEINFDGREVTRVHTNRLNMEQVLSVNTVRRSVLLVTFILLRPYFCFA